MQVRKQQIELDMKQKTSSKLGKEYNKAVFCHLSNFTYVYSTSCKMPDWMKHKLESRLLGEISITSNDTTFMAESEEELMNLLMKLKEESENWLKTQHSKSKDHGIWSYHFMVNRWGNSGNSDKLYFFGLQNHCRW